MIASDDVALRVLAAWACGEFDLAVIGDEATHDRIAMLASVNEYVAGRTLARLQAIGCLLDRDVTELADRLLQQRVIASTVTGKKRKR